MSAWNEPFSAVYTAADETVLIALTSGSTGQPKASMHFHRDILAVCDCFPKSILRMTQNDICIGAPPLAFTFGLGALLIFSMRVGAATVLVERLTPESLLAAIGDYRATIAWSSPLFYRQMAGLASRFDISTLRQCVSAGESLPVSTRSMWREATSIEIVDGIGSTEMLHIFIASAGPEVRPRATGKVVPGYDACILDGQVQQLPPDTVGTLAVNGPTHFPSHADQHHAPHFHP